ncbi:hypothetical protein NM208_g12264 [Fusarium decemcellulare]|uniref:Uncharacterized protein n=1 Tax=Fusarium decemcellulare TaxID=57161 RepID=A0ACC1RPC0_9HYPO|nr:hypothetical protein NM208_g12264 [Fusarium decemcellulare]
MVSIQPNMQMQDDLAALFSRNLTFNPHAEPAPAPVPQEEPQQELAKPIVYSSVHYTHSAHIARPQVVQHQDPPRPSSEPPQTEGPSVETILQYHGVDPNTLTPSQIQLFKVADPPQQERLIELWNICPPGNGGDIPALAWSSTTVEHEEQLARLRYERLSQQQQVMSLDGTPVQAGDGRWIQNQEPEMEPYMASGYEELMRRERERQARDSQPRSTYGQCGPDYTHATDPVYMGPDFARQQQMMEMATQYGAYQGFRAQEGDTMDVM